MQSVQRWAQSQGWDYRFLDDRFFDYAPGWVRRRCGRNLYAITDVARLQWAHSLVSGDYERVLWVDADILVFDPQALARHVHSARGHGFARELFLSVTADGRAEPKWGLNNALMVFDRGDSVLTAYLQACLDRLSDFPEDAVTRTAMGPALLQAMARDKNLQLIEGVGLFTPAMLYPMVAGDDGLMRQYSALCRVPPAAANLCHFMRNATAPARRPAFDQAYQAAVARLLQRSRPDSCQAFCTGDSR